MFESLLVQDRSRRLARRASVNGVRTQSMISNSNLHLFSDLRRISLCFQARVRLQRAHSRVVGGARSSTPNPPRQSVCLDGNPDLKFPKFHSPNPDFMNQPL